MKKEQLKQDIETLNEYINFIKENVGDILWINYPNGEPTLTREALEEVMELLDPSIGPLLNSSPKWVKKISDKSYCLKV